MKISCTFYNFQIPDTSLQTCYICGEKFPTQKALFAHRQEHKGERPFKCDTCSADFAFWTFFKMHELTHTPQWPELENDSKKLAELSRGFMRQRRNWRREVYQPPKIIQCPHCPRTCNWPAQMRRHIVWHKSGN